MVSLGMQNAKRKNQNCGIRPFDLLRAGSAADNRFYQVFYIAEHIAKYTVMLIFDH